jgi:DNA-binding response OmpR family regulator
MPDIHHPQPYRLFLVEDSPAEVRLIQEAVKEAQLNDLIEFEYAYDGEEACEVLDTAKMIGKKYDLVLLDLNLPKVSGLEVLEKIKTDADLEMTPVIVVTNSDHKKDMIECYKMNADGYLQKPADFKKLVDFFISIRRSIEARHKLSIYYIEKVYDELRMAV